MISEKKNDLSLRLELLNDAPLGVVLTHGPGLIIEFVNKSAAVLLESKTAQITGKPISDLLPELLSPQVLLEIHAACFESQRIMTFQEQELVVFVEGKIDLRWYDITVKPITNENNVTDTLIFYFADVSTRVQSRRAIVLNEDYLSNFFRQAPVALVLFRGEDFIVDFANNKALEIWGKSIEEVKGKPIGKIFPALESDPVIKARHTESVERLKRGATHVENEVELSFVRNGVLETGWYNYIHEPYKDMEGNIMGIMAISVDVTEQVLARKQLELITDALPSLVSYVNNREIYEFVNTAYEKWFSTSKQEVVGKSLLEVLGSNAYAKIKPHIDTVMSGNHVSFDSWLDYKEGGQRFISATYVPHLSESKQVLGYFGLVNDLTERKKYEQTIEENEQRLRLLVEGIGAGAFEYDLVTGAIHWSNDLKQLLGIPLNQVIDTEIAISVLHPDDKEILLNQISALIGGPEDEVAADYRIVRSDNGNTRWMHSRFKVLFSKENNPIRMIGFTIDITDRKLSEEKLSKFNQHLENEVKERTFELVKTNQLLVESNSQLKYTQSVLQQLIDSSVELIAVVDHDLKFLSVNTAFENFVHKSRSELIGKHIFEAYHDANGNKQVELLQKALAGERMHIKVNPKSSPNDAWFDTHIVPLEIDGKVEGAIALLRDISDITRSELALARANNQLEEAQRMSKMGSWEWDINTGTVIWSAEMYRIYGYDEKFPVDFEKATERMSPEDAERSRKRTEQHIQTAFDNYKRTGELAHEISSTEFSIKLPDGEEKILRSSGKIELDPEGKLYRMVGAIQDITDVRAAEERLRLLIDELESKNKDLESFNYVASHDLQEPLRKIQTFIDRLMHGSLASDAKDDYLKRIDHAAKRMTDLIQSMLTLSRMAKHEVQFTEVDLNAIVEYCRKEFELVIKEKNAVIQTGELPKIRASEFQLRQLFINLISNSFKFSRENPLVKIDCEKVNKIIHTESGGHSREYWRLTFTDNGIGFDSKYKEQIFNVFKRLHSKAEFSGTGIGLSIVKRIVERHSGFIEANSEPGLGASFIIYLPVH